ncbi:unnamed protein product [Cuscuta epithymum]|uniref:FAM192A/Fyv6 N-terminal domain-containing protein n=1 Tax=Cuscuta epithymum TaxID=186058 RepID=A0AAV0C9A8_9ASTE|nr:unnamed protein product [Cuscuta epithymum]
MAGGSREDLAAGAAVRMMNFVSENQLEETKRTRGARVEDGTAQRDRSLYEALQEKKDKKDAELKERIKHRPPKALDEEEAEFLDKLEESRREYEKQVIHEEARQLQSFQAAVAAFVKETPIAPKIQEQRTAGSVRKNPSAKPALGIMIKVKPPAKKAKMDIANSEAPILAVSNSSLVQYSDGSDDDE